MTVLKVELVHVVFARPFFGRMNKRERHPGGIGSRVAGLIVPRSCMRDVETEFAEATQHIHVKKTEIEVPLVESRLVFGNGLRNIAESAQRADSDPSKGDLSKGQLDIFNPPAPEIGR